MNLSEREVCAACGVLTTQLMEEPDGTFVCEACYNLRNTEEGC